MSGFTPRPEDLDDLPMPDEWREVADGVMPGNRERMAALAADGAAQFDASLIRITFMLSDEATPAIRQMADSIRALARTLRRHFAPHRTGHRHRGERLWRTRYAAGRRDLPLGMRTAAKLQAR